MVKEYLSIFVKVSNLHGDRCQKCYNYPVQGIQFMRGASYKFDWFYFVRAIIVICLHFNKHNNYD